MSISRGKKIISRALSLLLAFVMVFTAVAAGIGTGLISGGVEEAYAKDIGVKNEKQQQACDKVAHSQEPEGYKSVIGSRVYRGGDSYSRANSTTANSNEFDNDITDFADPLPYGNTFVDTSKLNWNTPSNFIIDIKDDRFVWATSEPDTELVDARENKSTNDPMGEGKPLQPVIENEGKPNEKIRTTRGIFYVGPLQSYHDDIKAPVDNNGYTNVIEPEEGVPYLYRITYLNAVTLPNGTRGNLVLTMKKVQIETPVTIDEAHPYTLTAKDESSYSYTKAIMLVQKENELGNDTGYSFQDSEGNKINQQNTVIMTKEEAATHLDEINSYLPAGNSKIPSTWADTDKCIRNAMGNLLDLDIEVTDAEGNSVNGTISYAAHDMDFESAQTVWGRPLGDEFSEGMTIVSGSQSYALVPEYNHLDAITRDNVLDDNGNIISVGGWLPVGPGRDPLDSALSIKGPEAGNNADGIRFASPFLLNMRAENGTFDNAIYARGNATSDGQMLTYQGDGSAANNNIIVNKYPDAGNNPITYNANSAANGNNDAKKQLYAMLNKAGNLPEGVTSWKDITPEMAWENLGNNYWKTYRNDFDNGSNNDPNGASFDSGFAVLLDAKKSSIQWSGSRVTGSNLHTKLFDSTIFTYVEKTHGTGGGIYLERYDIGNECKPVMDEGTVTMARYANTTVTAVPEKGYRVNRILIGDTNYGLEPGSSGLNNFEEYVIDGNDIKIAGQTLHFEGSETVDGFPELKTGKIELPGFYFDVDGNKVNDPDKKIVIERNADGTVDVTLPYIDNPMHVHADFGADYYFYKVWVDADPVPLKMTVAPAGVYPTKVTLPVPTGQVDADGKIITQDVQFEINGSKYTAQGGTYHIDAENSMDLKNAVFNLTPNNTIEYVEINSETGEETFGIRPSAILMGDEFVHQKPNPDTGEMEIADRYPITMESRVADWEGSDAKEFTLQTEPAIYKKYIKEYTENEEGNPSPGHKVWLVKYPSEGVDDLSWPELPVEKEPENGNHDAINHHQRNYWFVVENVPDWSTEGYSNKNADVPGKADVYYENSIWYANTKADFVTGNKLVHEEYEEGNAFMSVFKNGGEITNVPSIIVRGKKVWEDDNNAYNNRQDIWLHIDSEVTNSNGSVTIKKDVLPPQKVAADASGNGLIKQWGAKEEYPTGVSNIFVKKNVKSVPSNAKYQSDGSYVLGNNIYWVNELSEKDELGNEYRYTIRETLDREGNLPVEKDNANAGLLGYTSKDVAEWSELSTEKEDSSKFAGKDRGAIAGYEVDRFSGELVNTLETIDVEATKVWDDNNDQDGYRTDITLTLEGLDELPNGQAKTFEIKKDATGEALKKTWTDLPAYVKGEKVAYRVSESGQDEEHYTSTAEVEENKTTITNKHIPETASISIFKKWDDADNQDGLRKEAAKVLLEGKTASKPQYQSVSDQEGNGIVQGTVPVEDGLVITWLNVPVKRNGEDITYKIHEDVAGLGGYYTDPTYVDEEFTLTNGENKEATITNKQTPKVTEITITKEWNDMDDHDGIRPASVKVQLVKTYQKITDTVKEVTKEVTVNDKKYPVKKTADDEEYLEIEYFEIDEKYYRADEISEVNGEVTDYEELTAFDPEDTGEVAQQDKTVDVGGTLYPVKKAGDVEYYEKDGKYFNPGGSELTAGENDFNPTADDEIVQEPLTIDVDGTEYEVKVGKLNGEEENYYEKDGKFYNLAGEELIKFVPTAADADVKVEVAGEPEYKESEEKTDYELNEGNGWTVTISDLNVNEREGQKVAYSVEEAEVPEGYEAIVTSTEAGKFTVTNKHEVTIKPPVGEPEVTEDYKGKQQTSPKIKFTPDPDTLGPGGTENKIERVTLVDEDGNEVNEVTVPGEGKYVLNEDGTITFTPEPEFVGKTSGVKVRGYDSNGMSADTTYTPTVKHKVKYVDPLNPDGEQVVEGPRDCKTPDASDDKSSYEGEPGTESKNHPGYRFDGWDEEEVDDPDHPGDKITVRTAKYTPMYNINYDPNGGTGEMEDNNYAADNPAMPHDKNTFTREGYTFTGFKAYITDPTTGEETPITDENGEPLIFQDMNEMKEYFEGMPGGTSIRMEAQWEKDNWVRYIDEDGNTVYMDKTTFKKEDGEPDGPPAPKKPGYTFNGWDREEDEDGNITYIARWTPEEYTIKYDPNGGEGEMTDQHFTGEDKTAKSKENEFTREGYEFDGFKAKDKSGNYLKDPSGNDLIFRDPYDFITYLKNQGNGGEITLEAQWKKLPTVTYIDPATGKVIQKTLPFLDEETEPDAPEDPTRKGYTFDGWDRVVDEEGNVTYLAKWKPASEEPEEKTYNVTYLDPATGRVIQKTITVKVGDPEPSAPKDPTRKGYTFAGWDRVVDEEGNITYLAKWTPNPDNIRTGDSSNIWLWIGLLAAAVIAALGFTVARRKKQ